MYNYPNRPQYGSTQALADLIADWVTQHQFNAIHSYNRTSKRNRDVLQAYGMGEELKVAKKETKDLIRKVEQQIGKYDKLGSKEMGIWDQVVERKL